MRAPARDGAGKTALVIGATSDLGRATARRLAAEGWSLQLAARDPQRLQQEAQDLRARTGALVATGHCDLLDEDGGAALLNQLDPLPDAALCVVGLLDPKAESQRDGKAAERVMRTNYLGPALLLEALAKSFERRGYGVLVGFSSVAGDRGRAVNYIYGSAKAGLSAFLSGLRNRLAPSGVHVMTVKPGLRQHPHDRGNGVAGLIDRHAGGSRRRRGESLRPAPRCGVCAPRLAPAHVHHPRPPRRPVQTPAAVAGTAETLRRLPALAGASG